MTCRIEMVGGPGRLRTYDNPVMSRGLYQLSYGSKSNVRKYALILSVWQEERCIPRKKGFLPEMPGKPFAENQAGAFQPLPPG